MKLRHDPLAVTLRDLLLMTLICALVGLMVGLLGRLCDVPVLLVLVMGAAFGYIAQLSMHSLIRARRWPFDRVASKPSKPSKSR